MYFFTEENLPIRIFIQDEGPFTPEDAGFLILAFEYTLRTLNGIKRTDTLAIAKALAALGLRPGDTAESFNGKTTDDASRGVA